MQIRYFNPIKISENKDVKSSERLQLFHCANQSGRSPSPIIKKHVFHRNSADYLSNEQRRKLFIRLITKNASTFLIKVNGASNLFRPNLESQLGARGYRLSDIERSGKIKRQVSGESEILGHMAPLAAVKTRYSRTNVGRDRCRIGK